MLHPAAAFFGYLILQVPTAYQPGVVTPIHKYHMSLPSDCIKNHEPKQEEPWSLALWGMSLSSHIDLCEKNTGWNRDDLRELEDQMRFNSEKFYLHYYKFFSQDRDVLEDPTENDLPDLHLPFSKTYSDKPPQEKNGVWLMLKKYREHRTESQYLNWTTLSNSIHSGKVLTAVTAFASTNSNSLPLAVPQDQKTPETPKKIVTSHMRPDPIDCLKTAVTDIYAGDLFYWSDLTLINYDTPEKRENANFYNVSKLNRKNFSRGSHADSENLEKRLIDDLTTPNRPVIVNFAVPLTTEPVERNRVQASVKITYQVADNKSAFYSCILQSDRYPIYIMKDFQVIYPTLQTKSPTDKE